MQQTDWTPLEEVYDDLEFLDNENDRPWLLCPECGEWLDRDGCPIVAGFLMRTKADADE